MLAPLSWLSDFINIKLPLKDLMWKLTEVGLTCEKVHNIEGEQVLELEITPNRPDCMSVMGIAREIAAIQGYPLTPSKPHNLPHPSRQLPIELKPDFNLFERWSAIVLSNITIKPSPDWLKKRLRLINLRPINNIVDITNYVMFELGIPLHAFDYDEIKGHYMEVATASGGEKFITVDEITYKLPKNAMIIKDKERIIDLVGIKGGLNSGIKNSTKNILLHVTIDNPVLIRRASQALSLRSDASVIYERGPDKGGTVNSLKRAASLILELAGGEVASEIIDLKEKEFKPWTVEVSHDQLTKILGINIDPNRVLSLLSSLSLSTTYDKKNRTYKILVPTYRNDLHIPEDIIEEIARLHGYNKFPKTLPSGQIPTQTVAYHKNTTLENKVKQILWAAGLSEIYTYSLISHDQLIKLNFDSDNIIKVANPVSREFEILRPTLIGNMLEALKLNEPLDKPLKLFELGKTYHLTPNSDEPYMLTLAFSKTDFLIVKGIVEELLFRLGIKADFHPGEKPDSIYLNKCSIKSGDLNLGNLGLVNLKTQTNFGLKNKVIIVDLDYQVLEKSLHMEKHYTPIPTHPPVIEDFSFTIPDKTHIGPIIERIKNADPLIIDVNLVDSYENSRTIRVTFQDPQKNLSDKDIAPIREKIKRI